MVHHKIQNRNIHAWLSMFSKVMIGAIIIVGLIVLLGWCFEIDPIKRPIPGLVAMNPMTAFGLILLGLASWLIFYIKRVHTLWVAKVLILVLTMLAFWRILGEFFDVNPQIDKIFFKEQLRVDDLNNLSSRMGPNTAFLFLLSGIVIFLPQSIRLSKLLQFMAMVIMGFSLYSIFGYLFNVKEFIGVLSLIPMAIHTALCFFVFALAVFFQTSDKGFMKEITSPYEGGRVGRILLPIAIITPLSLGYFWLEVLDKNSFSMEYGIVLMIVSITVILVGLIWFIISSLNRESKLEKHAVRQIKEAHNLLYSSIESLKDIMIFSIDTEYNLLNFNSAFKEATDGIYGVDITVNKNLLEYMTKEDRKKAKQNIDRALGGENHSKTEVYGGSITFETKYNPIKNDDQEVIGVTVLSSDISERRRAEEKLKQTADRLLLATRGSKIGIWDYDILNKKLILDDRMLELYGISKNTYKGDFETWINGLHPDDMERIDLEMQMAINGEKELDTEFRILWPDESIRYIRSLALVQRDESGNAYRMIGTNWDITDIRTAESTLKTFHKAIAEIKDYAIILLDTKGNIQNWNKGAETIKGYTESEILGENWQKFYTKEDRDQDKPKKLIETAKRNGQVQDDGWRVRKNGEKFWASANITSIHDDRGRLTGFSNVIWDLTERRKMEQLKMDIVQLKSKDMEQLVYITSHDLKEPLLTIKNYIQLLIDEYHDLMNADVRHLTKSILNASTRMEALILGLLDYSRLSKPKELKMLDCNEVLDSVKADLNSLIESKHAVIIDKNLPKLKAYPLELKLLFQNLIHNAIKFSREDATPELAISAEKIVGGWQFKFEDNGIGIAEKDFELVFTIFRKAHKRDEYEGTGIGLAHVKKIIEIHNGSIWVESKINKGTTFYFTILTEFI
ncbi:MAG TPA: PAS domain S-box protein [Fulvivirga sp.]|nr:PAS domain S-box protein [Fulvivirga sp.]